jgi:AmmeMemoRadiSam system protein A
MISLLGSSDMTALCDVAAVAIEREAGRGGVRPHDEAVRLTNSVSQPGASFVTLTVDDEPAGCKGSLERRRPLWMDVARNARRAAFEDQRFAPVTIGQLHRLTIRVSVLSLLEEIPASSIEVLAASLRPGVDGLVLSAEGRGATFLPHVWHRHPAPKDFVAALVRKAGWRQPWFEDASARRYTTQDVTRRFVD